MLLVSLETMMSILLDRRPMQVHYEKLRPGEANQGEGDGIYTKMIMKVTTQESNYKLGLHTLDS